MRSFTTDFRNELASGNFRPAILYEGIFSGLTLRLWNGNGDLSWNGQTWQGNGWFHGWSGGGDVDDMSSGSIDVILSGVPEQLNSQILGSSMQGATGTLYLAALNSSGAVIADPVPLFVGYLDVPTIDYNVESPQLTITYETRLVDLDKPVEFRYDNETQQFFYPGDLGFQYVLAASEWNGQWGATKKEIKKKTRDADRKAGSKKRKG